MSFIFYAHNTVEDEGVAAVLQQPTIGEAVDVTSGTGTAVVSSTGTYSAANGSNRVVAIYAMQRALFGSSAGVPDLKWGAVVPTLVTSRSDSTRDRVSLFYVNDADFPGGDTGAVSVRTTVNTGTSVSLFSFRTVVGVGQTGPTLIRANSGGGADITLDASSPSGGLPSIIIDGVGGDNDLGGAVSANGDAAHQVDNLARTNAGGTRINTGTGHIDVSASGTRTIGYEVPSASDIALIVAGWTAT